MYRQILIVKLRQRIPPLSPINTPKEDKLADTVARHNPKTYGGSYNPVG